MANRRSDDYIPTYADFDAKQEEMRQYLKENGSPYREYEVTYILYGKEHVETISGLTEAEVTESIKQSWWLNGIIVDVKKVVLKKKSERELRAEALAAEQAKENADD